MAGPRRDTRGIVDAPDLMARVRFRRRAPAAGLQPYLEHYWLIDWDLPDPYASHVVPHPSVNLVFHRWHDAARGGHTDIGEVSGVGLELFSVKLEGTGRVCGVQFRPGGFRPFVRRPVSDWTGRRVPLAEALPDVPAGATASRILGPAGAAATGSIESTEDAGGTGRASGADSSDDDARVAALDAFLLALGPEPDPQADRTMALVQRIREDRTIRRVAGFAEAEGFSVRALQRLFAEYVGVGPKWVILRYRVHEALERAGEGSEVDWARTATELGYSDQAHLVRDFTATVGVPPTAYTR